jgi:hypothetical protein
MLQRDVIGLVPPWLPDALSQCIMEIPIVGATAWCSEVPASLQQKVKSVPRFDPSVLQELLTPPMPKRPETNDLNPFSPSVVVTGNRNGKVDFSANPAFEIRREIMVNRGDTTVAISNFEKPLIDEKKQREAHAVIIAHYFTRLADGHRAKQITRILRQAMADRPKWDTFEKETKKYHADWERLKKLPGIKRFNDGSYLFPIGTHVPDAPKPPHEFMNGDDLPWLLLPLLLEKMSPSDVANEIFRQLFK